MPIGPVRALRTTLLRGARAFFYARSSRARSAALRAHARHWLDRSLHAHAHAHARKSARRDFAAAATRTAFVRLVLGSLLPLFGRLVSWFVLCSWLRAHALHTACFFTHTPTWWFTHRAFTRTPAAAAFVECLHARTPFCARHTLLPRTTIPPAAHTLYTTELFTPPPPTAHIRHYHLSLHARRTARIYYLLHAHLFLLLYWWWWMVGRSSRTHTRRATRAVRWMRRRWMIIHAAPRGWCSFTTPHTRIFTHAPPLRTAVNHAD